MFERTLAEVTGGSAGAQIEHGGRRVTVIITPDPDKRLEGRALRALRPVPVYVDKPNWDTVFGPVFTVPGGTELEIDDAGLAEVRSWYAPEAIAESALIPVIVRDGSLPPVPGVVRYAGIGISTEVTERGTGVYVTATPPPCTHRRVDVLCRSCLASWWRARAHIINWEPDA